MRFLTRSDLLRMEEISYFNLENRSRVLEDINRLQFGIDPVSVTQPWGANASPAVGQHVSLDEDYADMPALLEVDVEDGARIPLVSVSNCVDAEKCLQMCSSQDCDVERCRTIVDQDVAGVARTLFLPVDLLADALRWCQHVLHSDVATQGVREPAMCYLDSDNDELGVLYSSSSVSQDDSGGAVHKAVLELFNRGAAEDSF